MKNQHLKSLVGRVVNVYKGGPEANTGKLLGLSDDFLVLQTEEGEVIYYLTEHVKSISEDSQIRFQSLFNHVNEETTNQIAKNFHELLQSLKNEVVRIDRGGPESRIGTLLDVHDDYFTLYTEKEGFIFYKKHHIKSISKGTNQQTSKSGESSDAQNNGTNKQGSNESDVEKLMAVYDHVSADTFLQLLQNLQYSWVKINRGGPESVEGLLVDCNQSFLLLAIKEDLLRIPVFHVKNISVQVKNDQKQDNKQSKNKENKQGNKQSNDKENKDGNKKDSDKGDGKDNKKDGDKGDKKDYKDNKEDEECKQDHKKHDKHDCIKDHDKPNIHPHKGHPVKKPKPVKPDKKIKECESDEKTEECKNEENFVDQGVIIKIIPNPSPNRNRNHWRSKCFKNNMRRF